MKKLEILFTYKTGPCKSGFGRIGVCRCSSPIGFKVQAVGEALVYHLIMTSIVDEFIVHSLTTFTVKER